MKREFFHGDIKNNLNEIIFLIFSILFVRQLILFRDSHRLVYYNIFRCSSQTPTHFSRFRKLKWPYQTQDVARTWIQACFKKYANHKKYPTKFIIEKSPLTTFCRNFSQVIYNYSVTVNNLIAFISEILLRRHFHVKGKKRNLIFHE